MTAPKTLEERAARISGWSCDDRGPKGECRNPHGCHCREITSLRSRIEADGALAAEVERLSKDVRLYKDLALRAEASLAAAEAGLSQVARSCPIYDGSEENDLTPAESRLRAIGFETRRVLAALHSASDHHG